LLLDPDRRAGRELQVLNRSQNGHSDPAPAASTTSSDRMAARKGGRSWWTPSSRTWARTPAVLAGGVAAIDRARGPVWLVVDGSDKAGAEDRVGAGLRPTWGRSTWWPPRRNHDTREGARGLAGRRGLARGGRRRSPLSIAGLAAARSFEPRPA